MNWDSLLKAYPSQVDAIQSIKLMREKIEDVLAGIDMPEIQTTCREMNDLSSFIPLLAPACTSVWQALMGAAPSFDMASVLDAFITAKDVPGIPEEDRESAEAVISSTVSGFLHKIREMNTGLIPETWDKGECPFCGSYQMIGMDYEDRRVLACLSCGHSRRFPRIKCPTCGNPDHETLGYFDVEGIEGVRVCFCKICNHYFKVVDARVRNVDDSETEDALTLELDELAQKEGFEPPL